MFSKYFKCCRKLYSYQEDTYPLLTLNDFIHVLAVSFFCSLVMYTLFQFHLEQAKLRSKIRIQDGRGLCCVS